MEINPQVKYLLTPVDMAAGPGRNVAQACARFARTIRSGQTVTPDFDAAITRHTLIGAMERLHIEKTAIKPN